MDTIFRLLILFAVSGSAFAVPALPTFGITRAGTTTTYKVLNDGTGTAVPLSPSSAGTGIKVIDGVFNSSGTGYQTNAKIGAEIPAVKVNHGVSAANLAAAALSAVGKLSTLGLALSVGSAIYDYFDGAGLAVDSQGGIGQKIPITTASCGGGAAGYNPNTHVYYFLNNYSGSQLCPSGSQFCQYTNTPGVDICSISSATQPPATPIDTDTAKQKLIATPPQTSDGFSQTIKELHDQGSDPVANSPTVEAPSSPVTSAPQQSVNPDGTVQTKQDVTTFNQISGDTITATTNTTTTTTHVDGSTTTTVTNNAPASPDSNPPTDCEKYPDNIGCAKFGNAPTSEVLPVTDVPISLNPVSLGSGSCPAPLTASLSKGLALSFSFAPICTIATAIAPLVIAIAWLIAGYMVVGVVKD